MNIQQLKPISKSEFVLTYFEPKIKQKYGSSITQMTHISLPYIYIYIMKLSPELRSPKQHATTAHI